MFARQSGRSAAGILIAVTDHAVERFRQRVASRRGELDVRPEIASRISEAWSAKRVSEQPPSGDAPPGQRGVLYIGDLSDRDLIYVCRHDPHSSELIVITLWEHERLGKARVPRRFTDALTRDEDRRSS